MQCAGTPRHATYPAADLGARRSARRSHTRPPPSSITNVPSGSRRMRERSSCGTMGGRGCVTRTFSLDAEDQRHHVPAAAYMNAVVGQPSGQELDVGGRGAVDAAVGLLDAPTADQLVDGCRRAIINWDDGSLHGWACVWGNPAQHLDPAHRPGTYHRHHELALDLGLIT